MKDLFIIGSGGFAKEVAFVVFEINKQSNEYNFSGFVDTAEDKFRNIGKVAYPIIPENEFLNNEAYANAAVAIGIGNPKIIEKVTSKFRSNKFSFLYPNIIHPNVLGHWDSIILGVGNIITANCVFTVDIIVGSFNIFNLSTTIGHDTKIGDYNVINPGVNISGGVKIGNKNLLGTNSTVLQYISIGDNSILGGTALLSKNLDSNWVAVGVPAKPIKENI
jgi:sugar O-acyltransferase (sialic acid O-acetyltransferase NeuD family)